VPEPVAEDLGTGESSMHRHHSQTRAAYFRAATRKYLRATEDYINILREVKVPGL
jgi:predicted DNA-binding protein